MAKPSKGVRVKLLVRGQSSKALTATGSQSCRHLGATCDESLGEVIAKGPCLWRAPRKPTLILSKI